MAFDNINDEEAEKLLNERDRDGGVNSVVSEAPKTPPSLGKVASYETFGLPAVSESPWKLLDIEQLPSKGLFYPANIQLMLRSARTSEIRHWSTIDENDPIDVREKINMILHACTKFKVQGDPTVFNFNDFLEIDKYHILFRIHELTFPNQENKLWAFLKCENPACATVNKVHVSSQNLTGFQYPEELMKWYSEKDRCFVIVSEKLGETFRIYLPNAGMTQQLRLKREEETERTVKIDESFYINAPYLSNNWRRYDTQALADLKSEMFGWGDNKFIVVHKFVDLLEKAKTNKVSCLCEKCKSKITSSIFLGGSFTVKDIFIISAGLDELI